MVVIWLLVFCLRCPYYCVPFAYDIYFHNNPLGVGWGAAYAGRNRHKGCFTAYEFVYVDSKFAASALLLCPYVVERKIWRVIINNICIVQAVQ